MAGSSKAVAFRCYQCGVDFEQEQALLRHFKSKRHRELEDICEKVKEVQRQDSQESDTLTVVPVLPEVILPETNSQSWSMSGESDVEPDMDMDVSGSEQGTVEVTQDESSAEEEAAFEMENESLLMNES